MNDCNSSSSSSMLPSLDFSSEPIVMTTLFREPPAARCAAFAALLLIYASTVASNLTLGLLIALDATLHRPMYALMALLALTDIAEATNTLPRIMANLLGSNSISLSECVVQMFFYHLTVRLQAFILAAMALDRYVAVVHPLRYHAVVSTRRVLRSFPALVAVATVPILAYVGVLRLSYCRRNVLAAPNCQVSFLSSLSCSETRAFLVLYYVNLSTGLALPLALIVLSYALMFRELRASSSTSSTSSATSSSTASQVPRAATQTCVTHLAVIVVSFGSVFFTFFSSFQAGWGAMPPAVLAVLQSAQYVLPPALNPLIYGLRTANIRRSLARAMAARVGARRG